VRGCLTRSLSFQLETDMDKRIRVRIYDAVAGRFAKPIDNFTPGEPANVGREVERLIGRLATVYGARKDRTAVSEIDLRGRLALAWDTAAHALDSLEGVVREAEEVDRKSAAPTIAGGPRKTKDARDVVGDMNRANSEFWNK
jgi:hypothetical protein